MTKNMAEFAAHPDAMLFAFDARRQMLWDGDLSDGAQADANFEEAEELDRRIAKLRAQTHAGLAVQVRRLKATHEEGGAPWSEDAFQNVLNALAMLDAKSAAPA